VPAGAICDTSFIFSCISLRAIGSFVWA